MKRRAFISLHFYIYTITGPYPYHVANAKAKDVDEVNWRYIIERDFEEKTLKKLLNQSKIIEMNHFLSVNLNCFSCPFLPIICRVHFAKIHFKKYTLEIDFKSC